MFKYRKPIIDVIHLPALPGAPLYKGNLQGIIIRAQSDSFLLKRGGVDGLIIENYGDKPYKIRVRDPETIAALTLIAYKVKGKSENTSRHKFIKKFWSRSSCYSIRCECRIY